MFVKDYMSILTPITELKTLSLVKTALFGFMWPMVAPISSALLLRADHSHPGSSSYSKH